MNRETLEEMLKVYTEAHQRAHEDEIANWGAMQAIQRVLDYLDKQAEKGEGETSPESPQEAGANE